MSNTWILWSDALLLDDFEVVHQTEDRDSQSLQFTLIPKVTAAVCPHCGTLQSECHQKRDRDGIRDLPMGQRSVVVRVRVFEYRCSRCEKIFTPPCPAVAPGTHATERFVQCAAQLIQHGDLLRSRPTMWDGYVNAAKAAFGESVSVVIDRFDLVKNLQERLTAARRLVQKELSEADRKLLKGWRWLWCKNLENLTGEERVELQTLGTKFPELARLADQRESVRALFEDRSITTSEVAQQRLREWVTTGRSLELKPLDAFCQTLEIWLPMIAN